jgi:hypothetical protein
LAGTSSRDRGRARWLEPVVAAPESKEGALAWDQEPPKGRVPLTRPRRGRAMGSSILASLSEAGGNDPNRPPSRPLPPRPAADADRWNATHARAIARR